MQARQQANSSYGGFTKVVPFSIFFFIFFSFFFYFSFPSGIPWADFDMGREKQDSPTSLVGEPAPPLPSLHGGTTPGLIPVNTGIR